MWWRPLRVLDIFSGFLVLPFVPDDMDAWRVTGLIIVVMVMVMNVIGFIEGLLRHADMTRKVAAERLRANSLP